MILRAIKSLVPSALKKALRPLLESLPLPAHRGASSVYEILDPPYKRIGILNYETDAVSGEAFLLRRILPTLIKNRAPVCFDVGANVGDYTSKLLAALPSAVVHAFEPSAETYSILVSKIPAERVRFVAKGLSDCIGIASFFDYGDAAASSHASLHNDVLTVLHHSASVRSFPVELITLDHYCEGQQIDLIDFIKIDTEGNELAVLKGAQKLISAGGLSLIQFEFNEMNVVSRSFLKDFYEILNGYSFYRLMPKGLLPLGSYNSRNEIFAFQNILAVLPGSCPSSALAPFHVAPLSKSPSLK